MKVNELFEENLTAKKIPTIYKGDFSPATWSTELTTLAGGPVTLNGSYLLVTDVARYKIKSMVGSPVEVTQDVRIASIRSLKSLKGMPTKIGGTVYINQCENLPSLVGMPKTVKGLYVADCKNLRSLEGMPEVQAERVNLTYCALDSFRYFDKKFDGEIMAFGNNIRSFEFLPPKVKKLNVANNMISSFEHIPRVIEDELNLTANWVESFKGIHEHLDSVYKIYTPGCSITSGYLDLFKMKSPPKFFIGDNEEITKLVQRFLKKVGEKDLIKQVMLAFMEAELEEYL